MVSMTPSGANRSPARRAEVVTPARSILRGELDKISLATLLTILDMERRSGMLILQRDRQLGRLHIKEGRVVRARIEGGRRAAGSSTGAEAVYQLLGWGEGQFEVWQTKVDGRDDIETSTTFLLMEGARRADEARGACDEAASALEARW
jgi:hypothetical protein